MRVRYFVALAPVAAIASLMTVRPSAGDAAADEEARLRCASRVSLALTGREPDAELLAAPDPQSHVDRLLADAKFIENFSRFINSRLNPEPGDTPADDATYFLAKHVLQNNRPWHELFDGPYDVVAVPATASTPATAMVVDKADGLGYFRSQPWMIRYAGNEEDGYRLVAAYRIQQNIIGIDIDAVTNAPTVDVSATGRMAAGCRSCHYDAYFAIDKVARVLSRKAETATGVMFTAPTDGPQTILDGRTISNDKELVAALLGSTDHKFHTCRLAFQYLYGRAEATCEAELFDRCVDAYTETADMRAAVATIARDESFCE